MALARKLMTASDLWQVPKDGQRYALIAGEVRIMSPAGPRHGRVAINLTTPLDQHVRARALGTVYAAETGFQLARDPDTVQAPDVAFVRRERVDEVGEVEEGYWPGPPDLAVEVVSPNDRYSEIEEMVTTWLDHGTRMVIVVNPRRRSVTVYRSRARVRLLTEADTLDGEDVVPGWQVPVRDLFA